MTLKDYIEKQYQDYSRETRKDIHLNYIKQAMHNSAYKSEPSIYMDDTYRKYCCKKGDYLYIFQDETPGAEAGGWWIKPLDKTKETYGPIETNLYGIPVTDMYQTFKDCTNMKISPDIPESVENLTETYENCISLESPVCVPNAYEGNLMFKNCIGFTDLSKCDINIGWYKNILDGCANITHAPRSIDGITIEDDRTQYIVKFMEALGDTECLASRLYAKEFEAIQNSMQQNESQEYSEADDILGDETDVAIQAIKNLRLQTQELNDKIDLFESFISEMGLEKLWNTFMENNRDTKNTEDILL
jgi:hypothetical protein